MVVMKTLIITLNILFFSSILTASQYVFINTYPIRAKVIINGTDTKMVTPCLLKNEQLNNTTITISKSGYKDYTVKSSSISVNSLDINLVPTSFDLYFPERNTYRIGNTQIKGPVFVSGLTPGIYEVGLSSDKMTFSKTSHFLPYEAALGTALGISFAAMISTIVMSEFSANQAWAAKKSNPEDYNFYTKTTQNLNIAKLSTIITTSALTIALSSVVIADIATRLSAGKKDFNLSAKAPSNQDDTMFMTAMQFISAGEIERASQVLKTIISMHPQTDNLPMIYYQLGQNHFILGNMTAARTYWETFITDYPIYTYYDYVLKNLADIYVMENNPDRARYMLDKAVYTDNILTRESIISQKARIDYERYTNSRTEENLKLAERGYRELISNFPNSERLDTYFFVLISLYKSDNHTDKLEELKKEVSELAVDSIVKNLILSYF